MLLPHSLAGGEINYTELPPTIEDKIENTFGNDSELMIKIAKAESGLETGAYNPEWHYDRNGKPICQGSFGVFQIACIHHLENPSALFNEDLNIEYAKKIYSASGTQPWGVCRKIVDCG